MNTSKEEEREREKEAFIVHIHKKPKKKEKNSKEGSLEKKKKKTTTPLVRAYDPMKLDVLVSNMLKYDDFLEAIGNLYEEVDEEDRKIIIESII